MKTKIKTLKRDIDRYAPHLHKKYPMSKLISNNIEIILNKDIEDELIESWYRGMKGAIRDIRWEIKKMDKELFSFESIQSLKIDMDKHYKVLHKEHGEFFVMLYRYVECLLLEDHISDEIKESYKNVYSSVQIIQEEIKRLESRK